MCWIYYQKIRHQILHLGICFLLKIAWWADYRSYPPPSFVQVTHARQKLERLKIFCDKLHYRNHVDPWCRRNTNPHIDPIANATNTEICEQIFAWLAQYKNIVRGFNESTFLIYICLLCDLFNSNKYENLRKDYFSSRTQTASDA